MLLYYNSDFHVIVSNFLMMKILVFNPYMYVEFKSVTDSKMVENYCFGINIS